jgi:hypothetical protein
MTIVKFLGNSWREGGVDCTYILGIRSAPCPNAIDYRQDTTGRRALIVAKKHETVEKVNGIEEEPEGEHV